ncbi:Scr1 family TA system antitoxin-like transcriptional regulator [Streptomyces hirsutus]|uniref:Scr1 family TA system antitoxin-like transcriptional regulator n=1 Tax=Streptomyces hirsutus TaxID=35620 RepID=UPI0036C1386C
MRQDLLRREPSIAFSLIVEEPVPLRHTGGEEVTREMLGHLLTCTELWNVELQIVPRRQPYHAGTDGSTQLLETPERQWIGCAEGQKTGQSASDRSATPSVRVIRSSRF